MRKNSLKIACLLFICYQFINWVEPVITFDNGAYSDPLCTLENTVFEGGETVEYTLYYSWSFLNLKAGKVSFNVVEKPNYYHMTVKGRTLSSYEWFFKVRDQYEVFVDKNTLKPIKAQKFIQEGKYQKFEKLEFDWENQKVISHRGDTPTDKDLKVKTFSLENCEQDIVSLIYFTRNIDLEALSKGNTVALSLFMDEESWPLKMQYKGKHNVDVKGMGLVNAHKFVPETIEGTVFSEGTTMDIFVTDDQNQLPVLIQSPVSVGNVKAVLSKYQGLKENINFGK